MKKFFIIAASIFAVMTGSTLAQEKQVLRVCTGASGGNYEYTAKKLADQIGSEVDVQIINTKGSADNLRQFDTAGCDAAIVQSDSVYVHTKDVGGIEATKYGDLYKEYAHLLCNRASGIDDLGDLNEKTKIMLGPIGSGSQITWRGMVLADKEFGGDFYTKIPTVNGKGKISDIAKVVSGEVECLFYVGTPGNDLMKAANKRGDELVLVTVKDKDFDDPTVTDKKGNKQSIWNPAVLDGNSYATIMPSGALWGNASLETISVTAQFYVSDAWADEHDDAAAVLTLAVPDVKKVIKAEKGLTTE